MFLPGIRKLAMKYHPDKNPEAGDKFKEISMAYEVSALSFMMDVPTKYKIQKLSTFAICMKALDLCRTKDSAQVLSNPEKRKLYDQAGEQGIKEGGSGGGGGMNPMDIFDMFFGGGGGDPFGRGRYRLNILTLRMVERCCLLSLKYFTALFSGLVSAGSGVHAGQRTWSTSCRFPLRTCTTEPCASLLSRRMSSATAARGSGASLVLSRSVLTAEALACRYVCCPK